MDNKYVGYARVSIKEQNEDRQIIALMDHGVQTKNIWLDKASGKDFERRNYKNIRLCPSLNAPL